MINNPNYSKNNIFGDLLIDFYLDFKKIKKKYIGLDRILNIYFHSFDITKFKDYKKKIENYKSDIKIDKELIFVSDKIFLEYEKYCNNFKCPSNPIDRELNNTEKRYLEIAFSNIKKTRKIYEFFRDIEKTSYLESEIFVNNFIEKKYIDNSKKEIILKYLETYGVHTFINLKNKYLEKIKINS